MYGFCLRGLVKKDPEAQKRLTLISQFYRMNGDTANVEALDACVEQLAATPAASAVAPVAAESVAPEVQEAQGPG